MAGSSGSGKASIIWGVTIDLAPAIVRGEAQVHGIDLNGGVELGMGKNLFTRYAVTPTEAVMVLEDAVEAMSARLERMAGNSRQHTASAVEPLVVVLIDEFAALTSYIEDCDLKGRALTAMSLLCSQGRAVGYTVVACLQDPRKETIPNRGLFTQMVGFRLHDREETSMVFGDGAGIRTSKGRGCRACGGVPLRNRSRTPRRQLTLVVLRVDRRLLRPVGSRLRSLGERHGSCRHSPSFS